MKKIFLVFLLFTGYSFPKVLIWDFGGILFDPDKFGVARDIGIKHFVSYIVVDRKNPNHIQKYVFDFLDKILPMDPKKKYVYADTPEKIKFPLIMCHWQAGTILGPDIIKIVNKKIDSYSKSGYFKSEREKILLKQIISAMFDPETLAKNVHPLKSGVNLLKECANAKTYSGSKRNLNIGFSNWDPLSFKICHKKHKEVYKYFDHVEISGDIQLLKPDRRAYDYIIKKYKLNPRDCIFIDDQMVNANGARKAGMQAVVLENKDYAKLRDTLVLLGAL